MRTVLKLYFIRHGETEWNAENRMQGRLDSGLTLKGKNDARLLGERLKNTAFERIISSPSIRTLETARLIGGMKKNKIETDERLLEIHLGDWQGKTQAEIEKSFPSQFYSYWHKPERYQNQQGESFLDVKNRAAAFLDDLKTTTSSGNVLIVTHGVVIKTLYLLARNASIERIWEPPVIDGTSLTLIGIQDGKLELLLEGCTAHCN